MRLGSFSMSQWSLSTSKAALTLALVGLASCTTVSTRAPAPVVERSFVADSQPTLYTVRKYDTLYSIAWRHNLEYKALAAANGIKPPYIVHPGQSIRLRETASPTAPKPAVAAPPPTAKAKPAPVQRPTPPAPRTVPATSPARPAKPTAAPIKKPAVKPASPKPNSPARGKWRQPVAVRPERRFGGNSKGFDYTLAPATQVRAAAGGVVVYAGPGLGGYRHLVIVKVSERYLVAYGMNVAPKLKEGENVAAGAVVAEIGSGGTAAGRFHFEIRDHGKPVDPSSLIGAS